MSSDFAGAFRPLAPFLSAGDITIGSLDAAISEAGAPIGCEPTVSLLAPATSVEGLRLAGYDVMSIATNHVKDCGASSCGDRAFMDTLANLRTADMAPVGGGRNLTEARAPALVDANGVQFGFPVYDAIAPCYHASDASGGTAPPSRALPARGRRVGPRASGRGLRVPLGRRGRFSKLCSGALHCAPYGTTPYGSRTATAPSRRNRRR